MVDGGGDQLVGVRPCVGIAQGIHRAGFRRRRSRERLGKNQSEQPPHAPAQPPKEADNLPQPKATGRDYSLSHELHRCFRRMSRVACSKLA